MTHPPSKPIPASITTKHGLLYQDGNEVRLPMADAVAAEYGYMCVERMVDWLEKQQEFNKPQRVTKHSGMPDPTVPTVYYEIIVHDTVVGVCVAIAGEYRPLTNACIEGFVTGFGVIPEDKWKSYGDEPWEEPASLENERFTPELFTMLRLEGPDGVKHDFGPFEPLAEGADVCSTPSSQS